MGCGDMFNSGTASGFMGDMFGKKGKPGESGLNAMPGYANNAYQDLIQNSQGISQQTTPFAPVAFNPTQQSALDTMSMGPQQGFGFGQQANTAYGNASGALSAANSNIAAGTAPITGQQLNHGINQFMNPYTGMVVNNAMTDINREAADQASNIGQQANNAGAYGGTRQAAMENELNRNVLNAAGNVSGNLYQSGFNTASSDALNMLQQQRQNSLAGAGLNLNQGAQFGQLGNDLMNAHVNQVGINQQHLTNQLNAGNIQNQYQQQMNQIPLNQQQFMAQMLGALPNTSQGGTAANPGFVGRISSIWGGGYGNSNNTMWGGGGGGSG